MKIYALFIFLFAAFFLKADETNKYPTTETWDGSMSILPTQIEQESLPAKDFPEGNWGKIVNGCQMSLRFEKQTYTNGEPITAILLLRNVTNQTVICPFIGGSGGGCQPIALSITTDTGKIIPDDPLYMVWQSGWVHLEPNTQHKYLESLNRGHHLTNGTYIVRILTKAAFPKFIDGKPANPDWSEIKSADVPIKIEEAK